MAFTSNYSDLSNALKLKTSLDDAAQYSSHSISNINNFHNYKSSSKILPIYVDGQTPFASQLIPQDKLLTIPLNLIKEDTIVTYQSSKDQIIHGLIEKNIQVNDKLFIKPISPQKRNILITNNTNFEEIILGPKNIYSLKSINHLLNHKSNIIEILFEKLIGWWIPDLDYQGSQSQYTLRFLLGLMLIIILIYILAITIEFFMVK